jgi:hypothetical protein
MTDNMVNRAALADDLQHARTEFHRILASMRDDDWHKPSTGTRWTNEELLYHIVFGYMVVQRLLILVRVFGRLPDGARRVFARILNAATTPFNVINYYGSRLGAGVYNRRRMGAKLDRVIDSLQRSLTREREDDLCRGMHFPTRWDPFFRDYMTLEDVYRYPNQHFDFHKKQLSVNIRGQNS